MIPRERQMVEMRRKAYHNLLAHNFLRNISLDGSHNDTALKIFNQPGYRLAAPCSRASVEARLTVIADSTESPLVSDVISAVNGDETVEVDASIKHGAAEKTTEFGVVVEPIGICDAIISTDGPTALDASKPRSAQYISVSLSPSGLDLAAPKMGPRELSLPPSPNPVATGRPSTPSASGTPKEKISIVRKISAFAMGSTGKQPSRQSSSKRARSLRDRPSSRASDSGAVSGNDSGGGIGSSALGGIFQKLTSFIGGSSSSVNEALTPVLSEDGDDPGTRSAPGTPNSKHLAPPEIRIIPSPRGIRFRSNERICIVDKDSMVPFAVASIIAYGKSKREVMDVSKTYRTTVSSESTTGIAPFEFRPREEISYAELLSPTIHRARTFTEPATAPVLSSRDRPHFTSHIPTHPATPQRSLSKEAVGNAPLSTSSPVSRSFYDPSILLNPDFGPSIHKTTMAFPSFVSSIIDYVNPSEMKRDINEKFAERYPDILLTYSKFLSIKNDMLRICKESGTDLITLSHAYVYFEKIVLKGEINKANRKLVAGTCLLLASKIMDARSSQLLTLIDKIESIFRVSRKDVMVYELPVSVELEFGLVLPESDVMPHYHRLMLMH